MPTQHWHAKYCNCLQMLLWFLRCFKCAILFHLNCQGLLGMTVVYRLLNCKLWICLRKRIRWDILRSYKSTILPTDYCFILSDHAKHGCHRISLKRSLPLANPEFSFTDVSTWLFLCYSNQCNENDRMPHFVDQLLLWLSWVEMLD